MPRVKRIEEQPAELEAEQKPDTQGEESEVIEVEHDTDKNLVYFSLGNLKLCLREPRAKDFILLEGWLRRQVEQKTEYQDIQIAMLKLASICSINEGEAKSIGFEKLFDALETFEDVDKVGAAIGFFRDPIGAWAMRLSKLAERAGASV